MRDIESGVTSAISNFTGNGGQEGCFMLDIHSVRGVLLLGTGSSQNRFDITPQIPFVWAWSVSSCPLFFGFDVHLHAARMHCRGGDW